MTNLPFDTINLSGDDVQILEDTYDALKAKFNIDIDCNIHFDIKKFDLTADTDMTVTTIGGLLSITSPNQFYLVF